MFAADRAPGPAPRPRAGQGALALAVLALAACNDGSSGDDLQFTTKVTIDPLAFLGNVQCSDPDEPAPDEPEAIPNPEAIQSYVATLTDESAEGGPSTLASSPPISCAWRVSFTSVVEGHEYKVRIDGYPQLAEELTPAGGETSGSPDMTFEGKKQNPCWTWECPAPDAPDGTGTLVAKEGVNVVLQGCAPPEPVPCEQAPQ
ncbi:hypothetical protein WME90_19210 [Sorangium sp. So ce375]|uniref:hypothetical protein n=1 Tax=Sorangium sp. So ce375 TaxID=3133306 RepID=UPI003F5B164E